jgi:hypothetical protein
VPAASTVSFHGALGQGCRPSATSQCYTKAATGSLDGHENEEDTLFVEDETKASYGHLYIDETATSIIETERQDWEDWQRDDKEVQDHNLNEERSQKQDLTMKDGSEEEKQLEIRSVAQKQLLQHVQNALTLHGNINVSCQGTESTSHSSESEETRPKRLEQSAQSLATSITPKSLLRSLSFQHQGVLEKFISTLKNEGVEVLKLGRRNNWQIRFLTVSREVSWPNRGQNSADSAHCPQCPRALLWLKQFNAENYSIDAIKGKGRGGVLFTQLMSVELKSTDVFYKKNLPRKFQPSFPASGGVVLTYVFEGGTRELLLCFKNSVDAESFCTSMKIIKKVVDRWMDSEQGCEKQDEADTMKMSGAESAAL